MTSAFDPTKARSLGVLAHPGTLLALTRDPQSGMLFTAGTDWAVYKLDPNAEPRELVQAWTGHDNYVSALAWVEGVVISAGFDRRLIWTASEDGRQIRSLQAHDGWVRDIAVLPDGKRLATAGNDMLVKLWDAATGELLATLAGHESHTPQGYVNAPYAIAASPDGRHLASADRTGEVRIWDIDAGRQVARLSAPAFYTYDAVKRVRSFGGIRAVCFTEDGARLIVSGIGPVSNVDGFAGPCRMEIWDWRAEKSVFTGQDPHNASLNHIVLHPTQPWIVTAGGGDSGGVIAFWDQTGDKPAHKLKPKGHIHRFVLDQEGTRLITAGYQGLEVWDFSPEAK